ncbi:MAG: right-handed parallel beta-helix repeat-containing protein [bacterium]
MKKLVSVLLAALLGTAAAEVWYVHPDSSLNSIQEALDLCYEGDTVLVAAGTWPGGYQWPATADITVIGEAGPDGTVVDGNGIRQGFDLFDVPGSGTLIRGLAIVDCYSGGTGGGVGAIQSSLTLVDCRFAGNDARLGGGLHCEYGTLTARHCFFDGNNSLQYSGGGISLGNSCTALIESSLVARNRNGGISFSEGRTTVIRRCDIFGNEGEAVGYSGGGGQNATAENNWWGDASGPWHPSLNPDGQGDTVSDWVDFDPWLAAPVAVAEGPTPHASRIAPGATILRGSLNLTPDISNLTSDIALLDAAGRRVMSLREGANDLSRLAPGVYFICPYASAVGREKSAKGRALLVLR